MSRTSTTSRIIAVVLLLLTAIPVPARAAEASAGPESFLERFKSAWQGRDLDAYAALLTADYRFHFGDDEGRAQHPDGWGRDDELASASHLFLGRADRPDRPRAQSIELSFDDVAILPDPEYPCDREHHALIDARRVRLAIELEGGGQLGAVGHHAYWIVKGAADDLWRVRRWDEEPAAELLVAAACPDTTGPIAGAADSLAAGSGAVAAAGTNRLWSVAPNPSRVGANAVLTFAVERDGDAVDAALYDVAGRRVSVLARGPSAAGVRTIAWDGRDAHGSLARAGVYFLRVRAGERTWRERVVRIP
jgi:hypothetical protein